MTTPLTAWHRLPLELRSRAQWLLAGPNEHGQLKVPTSVDPRGRLIPGSSTDEGTWLDFDYAVELAQEHGTGLGFVLSAGDPFTCIDLDVKDAGDYPNNPEKWTTPQQLERHRSIVHHFQTYTELSGSGKGAHLWLYGNIGKGINHDRVEIYSQERFIACTGNVVLNVPIAQRDELLMPMAEQMRAMQQARDGTLDRHGVADDDAIIWERARTAANADKFRALCAGDWAGQGYPSQSEADLSLMSMFTFYSKNDEQCRRMFRQTALGQREKAQKDDRYLDLTLKLVRGRQEREERVMNAAGAGVQALIDRLQAEAAARGAAAGVPPAPPAPPASAWEGAPPLPPGPPAPPPQPPAGDHTPQPEPAPTHKHDEGLPWPPGATGALAQFVYHSAPRPVREVAIVAALGFLAGVCGKAWVIPDSGLNLYVILVARSAIGKEAMHSGLGALMQRLRMGAPGVDRFVTFNDFASGPALAKACAENSSFVNVAGEWGRKIKRLASEGERDGPMQQLRTLMTNLYQKSGPASVVGGISYSDKDKNVASVAGVAYSMIGETTPGTLYDCLTQSMMEDGFLSRFTIIEYDGPRPAMNPNPVRVPDNYLASHLQNLCLQATTMLQNNQRCDVQRTAQAGAMQDAFNLECDDMINSQPDDEAWRQMWNRAHLKVLRISALLAVGDNYMTPVVDVHHVQWALDVVRRDINIMRNRLQSGDIGLSDTSREKKILAILKEYLTTPQAASYDVPEQLRKDGFVPRKYLQMRTCRVSSFTTHALGATRALDDALRSLCDSGYLVEADKVKIGEQYTYQGKTYRVVRLP